MLFFKHPIIDIYLPIVGRIYPIPEYIRQLLQNISNIRIYPSIVGRIYPIPEYICQLLAEYIQYQNISPLVCINLPMLPSTNFPGPNLPPTKFLGPNLPGPKYFSTQSSFPSTT